MADGLNNFFQSLSGKLGSAIGNPTAQQKPGIPAGGPVRAPFLTPQSLLSTVYVGTGNSSYSSKSTQQGVADTSPNFYGTIVQNNGYKRTETGGSGIATLGNSNLSTSPLIALTGKDRITNKDKLYQPGFTPLDYYRTPSGEVQVSINQNNLRTFDTAWANNQDEMRKIGDVRMADFKYSLNDFVKFSSQKNKLETSDGEEDKQSPLRLSQYKKTPNDNEDPVWFGFEVVKIGRAHV